MTSYKWLDLGIHHVSESVFMKLCRKVGSSQQVIMRRELMDFREIMTNQAVPIRGKDRIMTSGSSREGFRLKGSDVDFMFWPNDHTVIWDLDQAQNYDLSRKTLILCDCSDSPPGFALLELLTPTQRKFLENACMKINGRLYISSSKYRQILCSESLPNCVEHGPCCKSVLGGDENDTAHCLVCDFWPPTASKWIDRCQSWPQTHIVDDIVRNGCHFVAIGHKLGKHADKEWRISFSSAEQKLVYSMNHCQFLTYGLLKLFLKESINNGLSDEDKLLCSYHMKTAVFWAIQQNTIPHWHPQNLLEGFWVCFKLILKWVYEGVCPNFFITENNMFLSNIHGEAQKNLFIKLHELYERGIASLLHSPSIRSSITSVLQNPRQSFGTDEHFLIPKALFEKELYFEVYSNNLPTPNLHQCMRFVSTVEKLIILPLTQYQVLMLQKLTATILRNTAFMLYNFSTVFAPLKIQTSSIVNKKVYMANKTSMFMLKLAAKFGCISDMLFIAMFYYKTLRYKEAISVIEMTKVKLAQPYVMFVLQVNVVRYIFSESIWGQSWSTKMRHAVAWDIILENEICYIDELKIEQQSGIQCGFPALFIPLYVFIHMLEILCYRYVDPLRAQTLVEDLQDLVQHDQGMYIEVNKRDISWEILGICQQVTGNHQAALYSYQQSLKQNIFHYIRTATVMRIQEVMELICRDHYRNNM
ncbi:uncharacterized protein LOC133200818 [Saccostrea echinata]|uniref:uncharacterized protein LOC133200818 n=1 Tax=Saccostrea echinata TaxID=191078 RepID=UPI002A80675C|nr:uncharacterized protein LOC133200818 [Saccostrea echinata]